MPSISNIAKVMLIVAIAGLSACATTVSEADLYQANWGVVSLPHFDASASPDPSVIVNGMYVPRYLRAPPSPSSWAP